VALISWAAAELFVALAKAARRPGHSPAPDQGSRRQKNLALLALGREWQVQRLPRS
jgi:hypothetical protein